MFNGKIQKHTNYSHLILCSGKVDGYDVIQVILYDYLLVIYYIAMEHHRLGWIFPLRIRDFPVRYLDVTRFGSSLHD